MEAGNIVKELSIGKTKIKIADDYCRKTPEEVEAILRRIARIVVASTEAQMEAGIC